MCHLSHVSRPLKPGVTTGWNHALLKSPFEAGCESLPFEAGFEGAVIPSLK